MHQVATLPLGALRAFEASARLGSLKMAAGELGVTPAAVSHQIKSLEAHLGTALFDRLHRALRLTRAGNQLALAATTAFSGLGQALDELSSEGLIGSMMTLNVCAAPTFAAKWLAPRLHLFEAANPKMELRLRGDDALADPGRDRVVDLSIRYGAGPYDAELHADRLWPEDVVVAVCSPALGPFSSPEELIQARLLRTAMPLGAGGTEPIGWRAWFSMMRLESAEIDRAIAVAPRFGSTQLALEAASAGRGIALSPRLLVADDLAAGRLVMPFSGALPDPFSFWLLYRRDRADEPRIRGFVKWIRGLAAA